MELYSKVLPLLFKWKCMTCFLLQGEKCIMGQERMYRKRKESSLCIKGKSYTSALTAKPCQCSEKDFSWYENREITFAHFKPIAIIHIRLCCNRHSTSLSNPSAVNCELDLELKIELFTCLCVFSVTTALRELPASG